MEPKQNYLAVGIFVSVTAILALVFVIWLSGANDRHNLRTYQTFVTESVNGLGLGSPVKYRGVDVGKVTVIDIPKDSPSMIRIQMDIDDEAPITNGTSAVLQMQGITGTSYVDLRGTKNAEPLFVNDEKKITTIPSAKSEFRQIVDTIPDMLQKFTELANKMGGFATTENQQKLTSILGNLDKFSAGVGGETPDGKSLVTNLQAATAEMANAAKSIREITENSQADTQKLLKESAITAQKIGALTDSTSTLSQQGYNDLHQMLTEIKKTAREVQSLSRDLKDNPSSVIIPRQSGGVTLQ